jgi:tyrosyl-tRNA synthetase
VKEALAFEITERYHSTDAATHAAGEFEKVHAQNQLPDDMPEFSFEMASELVKLFMEAGMTSSAGEGRRHIEGGAVRVNSEKITDVKYVLEDGDYVVQIGKRKFAKMKVGK